MSSRDREIGRIEKMINLAVHMERCVEAPVQLIITTFLIMTGVLNLPWAPSLMDSVINLGHNKISFNGLPIATMIISALSILKGTMTINVFEVLLIDFKEGYLPFFCHAILFRDAFKRSGIFVN